MEGKSGFDVAAYLREALQTPFMFLSAFTDEATVAKVKELGAVAYLVKPLDIHQIVPAVEAAVANVRSRGHVPAEAQTRGGASDEVLSQTVAMAVGVLMHRYSLSRQDALSRLRRMAEHEGRSWSDQAARLLDAVELLALPATDQA
jgi:response regulator NasT